MISKLLKSHDINPVTVNMGQLDGKIGVLYGVLEIIKIIHFYLKKKESRQNKDFNKMQLQQICEVKTSSNI